MKVNINRNFLTLLVLFLFCCFGSIYSSESDQLYLNQDQIDKNKIYKYLFFNYKETPKDSEEKSVVKVKNLNNSVEQDTSQLENSLTIIYKEFDSNPYKLKLKLKVKDKRIQVSIINIIGNKVADIYKGIPEDYEFDIELEEHIKYLTNGLYICVVQGIDYQLKLYQKFTISR